MVSNNTLLNKQNKYKLKKCKTLKAGSTMINRNNKPNNIVRTSSFIENNKLMKNSFQDDFNNSYNNTNLTYRKINKNQKNKFLNTKNNSLFSGFLASSSDKNKKPLTKKNTLINKTKKKKDDLFSKINLNIQKTNENLNNPEEFYSNYFHSILEGDAFGKNKKLKHQ